MKRLNISKAMGEDQMSPKLVKIAGEFLVEPFTDIINSCFNSITFPNLVKSGSVTPIVKGGTDKHIFTNYRPTSV